MWEKELSNSYVLNLLSWRSLKISVTFYSLTSPPESCRLTIIFISETHYINSLMRIGLIGCPPQGTTRREHHFATIAMSEIISIFSKYVYTMFVLHQAAQFSIYFLGRKISSVALPWRPWLRMHNWGIEKEEKSPAPCGNRTHDLKSFAPQGCDLCCAATTAINNSGRQNFLTDATFFIFIFFRWRTTFFLLFNHHRAIQEEQNVTYPQKKSQRK